MDTLSLVVLLFIAFLAMSQGIEWLFLGMMGLLFMLAGNWTIRVVILLGVGAIFLLSMSQYWYIFFAVLAGLMIIIGEKKPEMSGGGDEQYSPELMRLLGGG